MTDTPEPLTVEQSRPNLGFAVLAVVKYQRRCGMLRVEPDLSHEVYAAYEKALDTLIAAARREGAQPWIDAMDAVYTTWMMDMPADPREAINKIIAWEQSVALDPAVCREARDLVNSGAQQMRDRAEKVAMDTFETLLDASPPVNNVGPATAVSIAKSIASLPLETPNP
jgi:hypothetical protein